METETAFELGDEIGALIVKGLKKSEDEDTLTGTCRIFGVMHHVQFIRVTEKDDLQVGTNDPHGRLDDLYTLYATGAYQTVEVPGFDGEWVACIFGGQ